MPVKSPTAATATEAVNATATTSTVGCRASHASARRCGRDMLFRLGSKIKVAVEETCTIELNIYISLPSLVTHHHPTTNCNITNLEM